jgi:hypothetical protein
MSAVDSWGQEKESAFLYRVLAETEPSVQRRELFARLAQEAEHQALIWEDRPWCAGWAPSVCAESCRP